MELNIPQLNTESSTVIDIFSMVLKIDSFIYLSSYSRWSAKRGQICANACNRFILKNNNNAINWMEYLVLVWSAECEFYNKFIIKCINKMNNHIVKYNKWMKLSTEPNNVTNVVLAILGRNNEKKSEIIKRTQSIVLSSSKHQRQQSQKVPANWISNSEVK